MRERTILHYLEDILKALESIQDYVENMEFDSFKVDKKTIRATEREFEIIGESVKKLPDSLTSQYPDTPWRAIAGMRDRFIHHYWDTDKEIVWKTIHESIPDIERVVTEMIRNTIRKQ